MLLLNVQRSHLGTCKIASYLEKKNVTSEFSNLYEYIFCTNWNTMTEKYVLPWCNFFVYGIAITRATRIFEEVAD